MYIFYESMVESRCCAYKYVCIFISMSVLISHTSKVMHKILQARLQQYVNHELPDVQAGFRKGRGLPSMVKN